MNKRMETQIALDIMDLSESIKIANICVLNGFDVVEIGTPVIKMYGMVAVNKISEKFSNTEIVADTKIVDMAELEAKMAFEAGADTITVMASTNDSTLLKVAEIAKNYNKKVMCSLLGTKNKMERAIELDKFNFDFIIYHHGVDENKSDIPIQKIAMLESKINTKLAYGGGVNLDNLAQLGQLEGIVQRVIIGRGIYESKNPAHISEQIIKQINNRK